MIAVAFVLSLLAGIFASLRVCRIKARLALSGPPSATPSAKPCHTRGVATILLTVFAFVLFLAGGILGWIGVLPVSAIYCSSSSVPYLMICSTATGAGSILAGVVIATSFIAMVLDASSHCCCKSIKSVAGSSGGATIIVNAPPHAHFAAAAPYHHAAATYWRKATDGKEAWFVQDGTGQTAWALPAGGVLVG